MKGSQQTTVSGLPVWGKVCCAVLPAESHPYISGGCARWKEQTHQLWVPSIRHCAAQSALPVWVLNTACPKCKLAQQCNLYLPHPVQEGWFILYQRQSPSFQDPFFPDTLLFFCKAAFRACDRCWVEFFLIISRHSTGNIKMLHTLHLRAWLFGVTIVLESTSGLWEQKGKACITC